ncbi:MAG: tetraacyldisaccharide 4'-kinase [Lentisphaeria bacterium]|nr:tetraacyldisaccharide 4'-kinase [Lentisphaeria bacterium]
MSLNHFIEGAETYLLELINGKRHSRKDKLLKYVLFSFSRVYLTIVKWRISLYKHRIFKDQRLGCLVISIGNVTCGGTGKTPVVEVFARTLNANKRRVAVLSRGYRSKSKPLSQKLREKFLMEYEVVPPRVVSNGREVLLDSHMAGDEPYMLARNLKGVVVLVDKDRVKSGQYAIRHFNADTLILDDGFQYLPLKPRVNILLVDSTNPFTNHHMLPRGLLREPIANITRADYIFLTKSNGGDHLRHMKQFLRKHNRFAEIIECTHRPKYLENLKTGEKIPLDSMKSAQAGSISGIAVPESFENFLIGFGAELCHIERYVDHHRYTKEELESFVQKSLEHGAEMLLTTEKDAVRFPEDLESPIPIYFLRVEIDILSGQENFEECIARICATSLNRRTILNTVMKGEGKYEN